VEKSAKITKDLTHAQKMGGIGSTTRERVVKIPKPRHLLPHSRVACNAV
jgi:hypothetical protein